MAEPRGSTSGGAPPSPSRTRTTGTRFTIGSASRDASLTVFGRPMRTGARRRTASIAFSRAAAERAERKAEIEGLAPWAPAQYFRPETTDDIVSKWGRTKQNLEGSF